MKFVAAIALLLLSAAAGQNCTVPGKLLCAHTDSAPVLDADLGEWAAVSGLETEIHMIGGAVYDGGAISYKCLYDDDAIYFAFEIPGEYRFDTEDNHLCAAIGTMFKVGPSATYINMGGCPDALQGCADSVPKACDDYLVDIGAHWELKTTEQGVEYPINVVNRTGNDEVANKDDEYAVSSACRFDDDDEVAGNEWAGAWKHTDPEGEGSYIFEMSRLLTTESTRTDIQLEAGETYRFGIAYWDPFENAEIGWTKIGHYLTGCAEQWIDLVLLPDGDDGSNEAATIISCDDPAEMICMPTLEPPTLDGDLTEWASIGGIETPMHSIFDVAYPSDAKYKCSFDADNIYFSLEIPGEYRFDTEDNKLCAAIGTMLKVGEKSTFVNMGGCPEDLEGCDAVSDACEDYRVDLGAHWELKTTEQGVTYPINVADGTGNDEVANKDDEYSSSAFCRFDDDDAAAGNEWAGAWSHTNPVDGGVGSYIFELSRSLKTDSTFSDAQLTEGNAYEFGIAYWDPFQTDDAGWTAIGHYLTGCGRRWINLKLEGVADKSDTSGTETIASILTLWMYLAALVVAM